MTLRTFVAEAKEKIFQKLKVLLDNEDVGMTKSQYLDMMEQMGEEPDWEKCPAEWEDFPASVVDAVNIYHSLGNRVYPDVGFVGKDYTNFEFLLQENNVERNWTFEICQWLERRAIEESQKKIKAEYDKIKRKR